MLSKKNLFIMTFFFFCLVFSYTEASKTVRVKIFPVSAELRSGNQLIKAIKIDKTNQGPIRYYLKSQLSGTLTFTASGYKAKQWEFQSSFTGIYEDKLEPKQTGIELIGEISTGKQPKSVEFTPDGRFLIVPLLHDYGIDVFSLWPLKHYKRIAPPAPYNQKTGYVESAFVESRNELWISQMMTNMVHIFDLESFEYKESFSTKGQWSKVITISPDENRALISNWISKDITVFDVESKKLLQRIPVGAIPRGMAFNKDGSFFYAGMFDPGYLKKINAANYQLIKNIKPGGWAKRHIVYNSAQDCFVVSDMSYGYLEFYSAKTDKLLARLRTAPKTNTVACTPDGKFAIASCRGPNNPETYLRKGPEFGKIYIVNCENFQLKTWVWGRNQPTGLAIHPEGRVFAFTDFLDNNLELYSIEGLYQKPQSN